jgi:creatinine amidohydrolase
MQLAYLTSPAVAALSRDVPIVFPIGAVEQHSHHLPVFTDSLVIEELSRRADEQLTDQVLFAPVMWLGSSHHHLDFSGTLSASPRVYIDLLRDLAESFLHHGFRRLVFLNGHGGNTVPAQQALFELRQKYRERQDLLLLMANYWMLGENPAASIPGLTQPAVQHACQWETSIMLALQPQHV